MNEEIKQLWDRAVANTPWFKVENTAWVSLGRKLPLPEVIAGVARGYLRLVDGRVMAKATKIHGQKRFTALKMALGLTQDTPKYGQIVTAGTTIGKLPPEGQRDLLKKFACPRQGKRLILEALITAGHQRSEFTYHEFWWLWPSIPSQSSNTPLNYVLEVSLVEA